jgi:hypothetical protein
VGRELLCPFFPSSLNTELEEEFGIEGEELEAAFIEPG